MEVTEGPPMERWPASMVRYKAMSVLADMDECAERGIGIEVPAHGVAEIAELIRVLLARADV